MKARHIARNVGDAVPPLDQHFALQVQGRVGQE